MRSPSHSFSTELENSFRPLPTQPIGTLHTWVEWFCLASSALARLLCGFFGFFEFVREPPLTLQQVIVAVGISNQARAADGGCHGPEHRLRRGKEEAKAANSQPRPRPNNPRPETLATSQTCQAIKKPKTDRCGDGSDPHPGAAHR